jgi:hypothetical protein
MSALRPDGNVLSMMFLSLVLMWFAISGLSLLRADVIRVPDDAVTIQDAFGMISAGDTVLVALGTYAEALTAPPLRFTLKGDVITEPGEYPRPLVDLATLEGSDTMTCLRLPAGSRGVIEDMNFRNGRIAIRTWTDSVVIRRCILDSCTYGFYQTWVGVQDNTEFMFSRCIFRETTIYGLNALDYPAFVDSCEFRTSDSTFALCRVGRGARVTACVFKDSPSGKALIAGGDDVVVSDCQFGPITQPALTTVILNVTRDIFIRRNVFTHLLVEETVLFAGATEANAFTIEDNLFTDNRSLGVPGTAGIRADRNNPFYQPRGGTIRDNVFMNCFAHSGSNAIDGFAELDLSGNRFLETLPDERNQPTVRLREVIATTLRDNLFGGTGFALDVDSATVDAEWNWWGDASGPYHAQMNPSGQGDTIVGEVDFEPWYTDTSFLSVPGIGTALPKEFVFDAYPNPFNSTVTLKFEVPEASQVELSIFNTLGQRVATLIDEMRPAGSYHVQWDGSNAASGVYLYQFKAGTYTESRKMVLMK